MNILNVVNLPDSIWQPIREQYPDVTVKTELNTNRLAEYIDWADIAFGNVPVAWAAAAARGSTGRGLTGRLQWLQSVSAGMDAYQSLIGTGESEGCITRAPVRLTSARGVHHQPIAHHVLMMILALNRQLPAQLREQSAGIWNRQPDTIRSVVGQQVGVIGYGGIGEQLSPLVRTLGMRICGVNRSVTTPTRQDGAELWPMERLDELLQTSDHLLLTLPLTPETENFMNAIRLARVKPGAYLYNVGRGELVDETALVRALIDGPLGGAALDVFRQEPLPVEHPLRQLPNVIVTPHIAGHYLGLRDATFHLFHQNLTRFIAGDSLINEI